MQNSPQTVIDIKNIFKSFHVGVQDVPILKGLSFEVYSGDFLIIFGPSGCGKSTLLHIMLGLEEPTQGSITFLGKNLYAATTEDDRSDFRKQRIGMVYQQPNWIKSLSVLDNVAFPLILLGQARASSRKKATELLETIGMTDWKDYFPTELSSGQQQRVALARAMITDPPIIIADEPTGNLDYTASQELMQYLTDLNRDNAKTIIMVTHDLEYLSYAKRAVRMFNGKVVGIYEEEAKKELLNDIKSKRGNSVYAPSEETYLATN